MHVRRGVLRHSYSPQIGFDEDEGEVLAQIVHIPRDVFVDIARRGQPPSTGVAHWAGDLRVIAEAVADLTGVASPALEALHNEMATLHNRRESDDCMSPREYMRLAGLEKMFDLIQIAGEATDAESA